MYNNLDFKLTMKCAYQLGQSRSSSNVVDIVLVGCVQRIIKSSAFHIADVMNVRQRPSITMTDEDQNPLKTVI